MNRAAFWIALCLGMPAAATAADGARDTAPVVDVRPGQLKPAFLLWKIGVGQADASLTAETVFPVKDGGSKLWRVIHTTGAPGDADDAGYDYYDVDAASLRPIVSEMKNPEQHYRITFGPERADWRRTREGKTEARKQDLPEHLYPEGPGATVFLASLPLRAGYQTRYVAFDRWRDDSLAVRTLRVIGEETLATPAGKFRSYVVQTEAANGYYAKIWVRAQAPHYPLRYEYGRAPDTLVSELLQIVVGP